ncbi:MAG: glycoside hydrolase family 99-like domain-containing protein [Anaerolineales bacterium]
MSLNRQILMIAGMMVAAGLACDLSAIRPTDSPVTAAPPSATPTLEPTPTAPPVFDAQPGSVRTGVRRFAARVRTTSDWTRTVIEGANVAAVDHEILQGADLPDLDVRRLPELRIDHSGGTGNVIEVEYDLYLRDIGGPVRFGIGKGHSGRTDLELLAVDGEERIALRELTHVGVADAGGPHNRRWFELDPATLRTAPQLMVEDRDFDKQLLAFYYPWYGSPDGPTGFARAWEDKPPPNTPNLGLYDSKDPAVFRQHIRDARQAGVDGFIVSWWGQGDFTDEVLQDVILPIAAEERFPITLYYERADSREQIVDDFRHILSVYGSHPAYMRVAGDPVLFIFFEVSLRFDRADWQYVFDRLEEEGLDCFCHGAGLASGFHLGDAPLDYLFELFDGVHMYLPASVPLGQLDPLYRGYATKASVAGTSFAATVSPGFDNSPWYDSFGFDHMVIERQGGDYYRSTWEAALGSDADWILLTSFNEWHEGTEIEPSEEHGEQYLDLTHDLVTNWNETNDP